MFGLRPSISPPNKSLRCLSSRVCPSISPAVTNSLSAVCSHRWRAKSGSSIWKRSLTRTASPRFGRPGVVVSGSERRNETYFALNDEVKSRGIVRIWAGSNDEHSRSDAGDRGVSVGQSGRGAEACFATGTAGVLATFAFDFGGIFDRFGDNCSKLLVIGFVDLCRVLRPHNIAGEPRLVDVWGLTLTWASTRHGTLTRPRDYMNWRCDGYWTHDDLIASFRAVFEHRHWSWSVWSTFCRIPCPLHVKPWASFEMHWEQSAATHSY